MSSETSTDTQTLPPWQLFALAGLLGATLLVFVSRGQSPAAVILLSLTVFAAAAVGAAALRTLIPFTSARRLLTVAVVGGRTRAAIEREKTLVLRSIKELEFDHAMGKVSAADFADMGGRLRARAAGLIRQLDAGAGYRAQIERELAARLEARAPTPPPPAREAAPDTDAGSVEETVAETEVTSGCPRCATENDSDARFCKRCGERLVAE